MINQMPTELQCLSLQMRKATSDLTEMVRITPLSFGALTDWKVDHPCLKAAHDHANEMLVAARTLEFAAVHMAATAFKQANDARYLYSLTMELVDGVRMARGKFPKTSSVLGLADFCEEKLANLQERIAEQFPGEEIPGD